MPRITIEFDTTEREACQETIQRLRQQVRHLTLSVWDMEDYITVLINLPVHTVVAFDPTTTRRQTIEDRIRLLEMERRVSEMTAILPPLSEADLLSISETIRQTTNATTPPQRNVAHESTQKPVAYSPLGHTIRKKRTKKSRFDMLDDT